MLILPPQIEGSIKSIIYCVGITPSSRVVHQAEQELEAGPPEAHPTSTPVSATRRPSPGSEVSRERTQTTPISRLFPATRR